MIETTNAIEVFNRNIDRTNALIEAMDAIKAYNRIYQMRLSERDPEHAKVVTEVQNNQLDDIEQACSEHAIISLATAFETYCKELLQELLADYPDFFLLRESGSKYKLRELIECTEKLDYEEIGERLNIDNRFMFYRFLKEFSIPFLSAQESDFIEFVYVKRNNFVHNAGKLDRKTEAKLEKIVPPVNEILIRTEAKRLRTKFAKVITSQHKKILHFVAQNEQENL